MTTSPPPTRRGFTRDQVDKLLLPIGTNRVLRDPKGNSHVSQQDVIAHLNRMFGFGNFDTDIIKVELVFEAPTAKRGNNGQPIPDRWDVCYRALVRLTIRDEHGNEICHYENGSTATAQNQARGDAHDLAYKSAISLSVKRAAINLGDQFGLSLYNKGQTSALVKVTLVMPEGETSETDVQKDVEQQVSLGNDEIDSDLVGASPDGDSGWLAEITRAISAATTPEALLAVGDIIDARLATGQLSRVDYEAVGGIFLPKMHQLKDRRALAERNGVPA